MILSDEGRTESNDVPDRREGGPDRCLGGREEEGNDEQSCNRFMFVNVLLFYMFV